MMPKLRNIESRWILCGILLISLVLNALGIGYTTPRCAFPDEESYITKALDVGYKTLTSGIAEGLYTYAFPKSLGPTTIYISIPMGFYILSTKLTGEFAEVINAATSIYHRSDLYTQLPEHVLTNLIVSARVTSVFFGVATVLLIYLIGREIWDERKALIPSLILAFSAGFVNLAHQVEETIPMTFFLTLTFFFLVRYLKSGENKDFIFSCIAAGFAIATKFNGGIILIPLFTACYLKKGNIKNFISNKELYIGLISMLLVFSFLRVGVVLDVYRFAHYLLFEILGKFSGIFRQEYGMGKSLVPVWILQILNLINGLGLPMFVLFVMSTVFTLIRKNKIELLLALSFVLPYIAVISLWSTAPFHFIVPVLPFTALIISNFIIDVSGNSNYTRLSSLIFTLLILHAAIYTVVGDLEYLHDSRDVATKWMEQNLPEGATVETYTTSLTKIPRVPEGVKLVGYYEHVSIYDDPFNLTKPAQYIQMERNYTENYMCQVCKRRPDYIVVSSWDYAGLFLSSSPFIERKAFYEKLLSGKMCSYKIVAVFGEPINDTIELNIYKKFLRILLTPKMEKVSPTIVILERGSYEG